MDEIVYTEDELSRLIQETINEVLENKRRGILMEMPFPRDAYKERIDSEFPQILINWSLVHYRTITNTEPYKKHWKGKFRGHMYNVSRMELKKNDSKDKRLKVLKEVISENNFSSPRVMTMTICNKFIIEKIDIHSKEFEETVKDCIKCLPTLCVLILNRNVDAINQYAETI